MLPVTGAATFIPRVAETHVPLSQAWTVTVSGPSSALSTFAACTLDGRDELDRATMLTLLCAEIETVPTNGCPSVVET